MLCPVSVKILIKVPEEVQQLRDLPLLTETGSVWQIGHQRLAIGADLLAADGDFSGGGGQQARRDFDKGGFAAAVGAKQADDFARRQLQIQAVQRGIAVVALGQACSL